MAEGATVGRRVAVDLSATAVGVAAEALKKAGARSKNAAKAARLANIHSTVSSAGKRDTRRSKSQSPIVSDEPPAQALEIGSVRFGLGWEPLVLCPFLVL